MMGNGMVSMGNVIIKPSAKKTRRIHPKDPGGEWSFPSPNGSGDGEGRPGLKLCLN